MRLTRLLLTIVLLFVATAPASAREYTADAILRNHAEAMGGLEKLRTLKTFHATGTVSGMDLYGTFESWVQSPNMSYSRLDLDIIKTEEGSDGVHFWTVGLNGHYREVEGMERQMLVSAAWQSNFIYLLDPQPDDTIESVGTRTIGDRELVGLKMKPAGGFAMTLWFNPENWYIDYVGMRVLGREMLTEFYNVQLVDGWLPVAMDSRLDTGFMKLELKTTSIELNPPVDPTIFSPPDIIGEGVKWPEGEDSVTLPLNIDGSHIFVKALVGEKELSFLIDTGAESNYLHKGIGEELGLEEEGVLEAVGYGGSAGIGFVKINDLSIGGIEIGDQTWASFDLSQLRRGMPDLDGILGYDFIANFVLEIDYDASEVTLYKPGAYSPVGGGEIIDLGFFKKIPTTVGRLDGVEGIFLLDTGSGNLMDLTRTYAAEHELMGDSDERALTMRGMGGDTRLMLKDMRLLEIGTLKYENPTVGVLLGEGGGLAAIEEVDGNIGSGLFSEYAKAVFDYGEKKLYLLR